MHKNLFELDPSYPRSRFSELSEGTMFIVKNQLDDPYKFTDVALLSKPTVVCRRLGSEKVSPLSSLAHAPEVYGSPRNDDFINMTWLKSTNATTRMMLHKARKDERSRRNNAKKDPLELDEVPSVPTIDQIAYDFVLNRLQKEHKMGKGSEVDQKIHDEVVGFTPKVHLPINSIEEVVKKHHLAPEAIVWLAAGMVVTAVAIQNTIEHSDHRASKELRE